MPIQELERDYLPTSPYSAEIARSQSTTEPFINTLKRIDMKPGLGRDSVLTEETGFVLWLEIRRFYDDLNFALASGKNLIEALNIATDELEVNIRTYNIEFIKSKTVLPHLNRFAYVDGVPRMVGNNGRLVVDAVSSQERAGSVRKASEIIESSLLSAEPSSCAVMMSPQGWSGYTNQDGEDVPHLNTQTMIFWKDQNGVLQGLTLITDLTQAQSAEVMRSLGVSEQVLVGNNGKDRLANIVKNPALISFSRSDINPFEYVLDKILAARGRGVSRLLQKDGSVEIRSVEQTRADIERLDELLLFDQKEEEYILELREFIMGRTYQIGDSSAQERIAKEIERTVLKMAKEHLSKNAMVWPSIPDRYHDSDDFGREIAFLRSRAGCSTGGSSAMRALGGVSLGIGGALSLESDQYGSLEFECPKCKRVNRRPKGQLIPNCQHCMVDVRC